MRSEPTRGVHVMFLAPSHPLLQVDAALAAATHPKLVRALFSATLPERVEELARSVLQQPLRITVSGVEWGKGGWAGHA